LKQVKREYDDKQGDHREQCCRYIRLYEKTAFHACHENKNTAQKHGLKRHENVEQKIVFLRCVENTLPRFIDMGVTNHPSEQGSVEPEY
jgi:hypothetical protein